ncbi:MAG: lmo0937 family membrane protein [Phenylobacterium sp.]|nr:MAG: lmo0937 family membrane protein [Phenylobacterium sp.]
MFVIIAAILVILWLLGFLAFHVTTAAIHILLLIAVVLIVLHFVRGRRAL